jgi:hypothetical protein
MEATILQNHKLLIAAYKRPLAQMLLHLEAKILRCAAF